MTDKKDSELVCDQCGKEMDEKSPFRGRCGACQLENCGGLEKVEKDLQGLIQTQLTLSASSGEAREASCKVCDWMSSLSLADQLAMVIIQSSTTKANEMIEDEDEELEEGEEKPELYRFLELGEILLIRIYGANKCSVWAWRECEDEDVFIGYLSSQVAELAISRWTSLDSEYPSEQ